VGESGKKAAEAGSGKRSPVSRPLFLASRYCLISPLYHRLTRVHPETRMNVGEFHLMRHRQFPIRKGGIFRPGAYSLAPLHFRIAQRHTERCKEIDWLRGGVPMYRLAERRDPACATAEGSGQIGGRSHRPRAKKDPFRTETNSAGVSHTPCRTLPKTDDRNSFVQP
jgi:hypothetical protein